MIPAGERALTKAEQKSRQSDWPLVQVEECSCCIVLSIPPHTRQVVDNGNLSDGYILLSGSYFLVPRGPRAENREASKTHQADKASLAWNAIRIVSPHHSQ
jgi:hypothetical protein